MKDSVALAALFGWILSFPLFGPLLLHGAGEAAPALGLLFLFANGSGLLTLHLLPDSLGRNPTVVKGSGVLLLLFTLLFPDLSGVFGAQVVTITLMGLLAALLILAWAPMLDRSADPLFTLASAMAISNLLLGAASLPLINPTGMVWGLLATLPLLAGFTITVHPATTERPAPAELVDPAWKTALLPLGAFALADYFVGGIWYRAAIGGGAIHSAWWPAIEGLLCGGGILLFYLRIRHGDPGRLVSYALSLLGLGLLLAAAGPSGTVGIIAYRTLLLLGLVAGDLFFWHQLWRLGQNFGVRRSMGIGLGGSLWLIALSNLATGAGTASLLPSPLFLLVGAAILFLALPVVFRAPSAVTAEGLTPTAIFPAHADHNAIDAAPPMPEGLTQAEIGVYHLLVRGASDQEIADRLIVSKHTVKFHVRNVLHKAGVANRRELLSRLLAGESLAPPHGEDLD